MMSTLSGWFKGSSLEDILAVSSVEPLGPITWQKLYRSYSSLQLLLKTKEIKGLTQTQQEALHNRPTNFDVEMRLLKSRQIKIVTCEDPEYPQLLKEISDPPLWLFYRGNLGCLKRPTISVVGSRKVTGYGKAAIERLFDDAVLQKVTTVSGLAYGVDKHIHCRSVESDSPTVVVLAGGLDTVYPLDHFSLSERIIKQGGLLLSEYPPLSRPRPYRFPVRNRIIAGLSPLTVIIEAALPSGSLTTAKSALEYNRDLFAVPGDISRPNSAGTNFLISQGATILYTPSQMHQYFHISSNSIGLEFDKELRQILDLLTESGLSLDQLCVLAKRPIETVLGLVTQLELLGMLYQPVPGIYCKNNGKKVSYR